MKILTSLAMALLLGGGAAWARESMLMPDRTPKRHVSATRSVKGIVVAADAALGTLTVKDRTGKVMVFTAMNAKIETAEGKSISLADISFGDEVSVSHRDMNADSVLRLNRGSKR